MSLQRDLAPVVGIGIGPLCKFAFDDGRFPGLIAVGIFYDGLSIDLMRDLIFLNGNASAVPFPGGFGWQGFGRVQVVVCSGLLGFIELGRVMDIVDELVFRP